MMGSRRGLAMFLCTMSLSSAYAGPDWVEGQDAGSSIPTAQPTIGVGSIHTISGELNGTTLAPDFEDMYLIRVLDPVNFQMTVTGASFDPVLWIFNVTLPGEGFGLLANDNTNAGILPVLTPIATDLTGAKITLPGVYAVAISGSGRVPVSVNGPMYSFGSPTEVSGPDGSGGFLPLFGWSGPGQAGSYTIQATGVGFYDTPAPASAALLAMGGLLAARRRR
jgi:hypothetical protein